MRMLTILALTLTACQTPAPVSAPSPSPTPVASVAISPRPSPAPAASCCEASWPGTHAIATHKPVKATSYYGDSSKLEGGYNDERGATLQSLQDFLAHKVSFVTVAMDPSVGAYGLKLCSPTLNQSFGANIPLSRRDNGGAFKGKSWSRIDINSANKAASLDDRLNNALELDVCQ